MPAPFSEDISEKKTVAATLRIPAMLISYVLHPIFVPIYVIAFLVYIHPSYFSGFDERRKIFTIAIASMNLVFYPLISVLLCKALGFIESVFLRTRKDRIIPYMICGIFFFWAYTVFKKQDGYPVILSTFVLGIFIASSVGLIANIYFKISMHAMGMGGWLGIFWLIAKDHTMLMTWPIALVLLLAGLVCTARLVLSHHSQKDIYLGFIAGFLCQVAAGLVS